ncbi:GNAT family N-acetyltransferase [Rhizobium sp. 0TCS1.26]|uniref:GNAT family N-acetyltransferase n=1 Tax=Rhizobium sp. 0TCS1.26 TaxID=3142623 RepID=UPI003D2C2351
MTHVLDRPAWNALASVHASLAEGSSLARRYPPSIVPFAAAADDTPESLEALAALASGPDVLALVEARPITVPAQLETVLEASLVQMIAKDPFERLDDARIELLGEDDAEDMLALATLTKPGPFTLRAQQLGKFWGIRMQGRLVAMAGQRMRQPGFAELSGLCTHPDFQGGGLGKTMLRFVAGEISASGDTVYLHSYSSNVGAVSLYRAMGFSVRSDMNFRLVRRADQA